jgi:pimeloyl-ACP methyl ester carboxylesterase
VLAIVDRTTKGPLLVVGSSMGGWIILLVALARPGLAGQAHDSLRDRGALVRRAAILARRLLSFCRG